MNRERLDELERLLSNSTKVVSWYPHSQHDGYHPGSASVRGPFGRWFLVSGGDNGMNGNPPTPVADLYDDAKFAAAAMNSLSELIALARWALDSKDALQSIAAEHLSEMDVLHIDHPEEVLWTDTEIARLQLKSFPGRSSDES